MDLRRVFVHALVSSLALFPVVVLGAGSAQADPPQCSNGVDDDLDGNTDYPADLGCADGDDPDESDEPVTVTVTPATAVNPVGTSHTVTATLRERDDDPAGGRYVHYYVNGDEAENETCISFDETGQCGAPFTYQGPDFPRTDVITACADTDADGTIEPGEPCGSATKTWVFPASTPGHVTGGGQVANATGTDDLTFSFNAKSDRKGVKGTCNLVDHGTGAKIRCLDVTSLVQSGNSATFYGNATVDGVPTTYRIQIADNGEPGRADVFRIETSSGYVAGGVIERGNIQVH